jgi:HTH-type transcriptional regulator/antitoxin HigA
MSALAVSLDYMALLERYPPKVIRTERENEKYVAILYEMDSAGRKLTRAEQELADLLTLLVENYEEEHYALPKTTPAGMINFLMDQHDLRQKDLLDVFGTASVASEVLSGKRELNKGNIERLAKRFGVSPELFF